MELQSIPWAYGIVYGEEAQYRVVVLDRAKAEELAARLHGVVMPLFASMG